MRLKDLGEYMDTMESDTLDTRFLQVYNAVLRSSYRRDVAVFRLVNKRCLWIWDRYAVRDARDQVYRSPMLAPDVGDVVEVQTLAGYRRALARTNGHMLFCVRHGLFAEVGRSFGIELGTPTTQDVTSEFTERCSRTLQFFLISTVMNAWFQLFVKENPQELFGVLGHDGVKIMCILIRRLRRTTIFIPLDSLRADRLLTVCRGSPEMTTEVLDWLVENSTILVKDTRDHIRRAARELEGGSQWIHDNRGFLD